MILMTLEMILGENQPANVLYTSFQKISHTRLRTSVPEFWLSKICKGLRLQYFTTIFCLPTQTQKGSKTVLVPKNQNSSPKKGRQDFLKKH